MLSFIGIVGFAIVFGLLAGGVVSMRPDHGALAVTLREALAAGSWAVVVHPTNAEQADRASVALAGIGGEPLRTL